MPYLDRTLSTLNLVVPSPQLVKILTTDILTLEDQDFVFCKRKSSIKKMINNIREYRKARTWISLPMSPEDRLQMASTLSAAHHGLRNEAGTRQMDECEFHKSTSGIKLNILTQKMAYRSLVRQRLEKGLHLRRRTEENIEGIVLESIGSLKYTPRASEIWTRAKDKDLRLTERYFLWMTLHDAYSVGTL